MALWNPLVHVFFFVFLTVFGMSDVVCAAAAGVLGRFPCHPLDTVKTVAFAGDYLGGPAARRSAGSSTSVRSVARLIYRTEGIRGFYRGVGIAVAGAAPGNVLYLLCYDEAKRRGDALLGADGQYFKRSVFHLLCGVAAEAVSCCVWVPIDVVKERLQAQSPSVAGRYRNSLDALRTIARNEGVAGLYKGYWSTLASFGPYSGMYFLSLELADRLHPALSDSQQHSASFFFFSLAHAIAANAVASVVTNPLELLKTRLQVQRAVLNIDGQPQASSQFSYQYRNMRDGATHVLRTEGVRGLWRGTAARVVYACPNAALTMALFRTFQLHAHKHQNS